MIKNVKFILFLIIISIQITNDILETGNHLEIKEFYKTDSTLICSIIDFDLSDTLIGSKNSWNNNFEFIKSNLGTMRIENYPQFIKSNKMAKIDLLLRVIDSNYFNGYFDYGILNKNEPIDYDYELIKEQKEKLKGMSNCFNKDIADSLIFIKCENYFSINRELNKWYNIFKLNGLDYIRKNKIYPFKKYIKGK